MTRWWLSSDSLIYGGLVPSRTHSLSEEALHERTERFRALKTAVSRPASLCFRHDHAHAENEAPGATEPPYYEVLGATIFRITLLEDKREISGLSIEETAELERLLGKVPAENYERLADEKSQE